MDARDWIDDRIGLVLGNDEKINGILCRVAQEAVAAYEPGVSATQRRETYEGAWKGGGAYGYERRDYADTVGCDIRDAIAEMIMDDVADTPWRTLLIDILDLGDRHMWTMIGKTWLPMPSDVEWDAEADIDA